MVKFRILRISVRDSFVSARPARSLRVTGTARNARDIELRESLAERGKAPDLVIVVDVVGAYFHSAKCIIRSGLWDSGKWADPPWVPPYAQILADHTKTTQPLAEPAEDVEDSLTNNLC